MHANQIRFPWGIFQNLGGVESPHYSKEFILPIS